MIESVQNPKVKRWAELLTKKGREKHAQYLVEGVHLVEEAARSGVEMEAVIWETGKSFDLLRSLPPQIEQWEVSKAIIHKLSDTENPQGIFAVIKVPKKEQESMVKQGGLFLLVDGVQDPGNLGTIIRSADAAGADAVYLGEGTVDLYNPKTVRSTMGSMFHLPIFPTSLIDLIPRLKQNGFTVVASSLDTDRHFHQISYPDKIALIVGNEGNGISKEIVSLADLKVKIPIYGKAESLNVAIATALLLYEAQRGKAL